MWCQRSGFHLKYEVVKKNTPVCGGVRVGRGGEGIIKANAWFFTGVGVSLLGLSACASAGALWSSSGYEVAVQWAGLEVLGVE